MSIPREFRKSQKSLTPMLEEHAHLFGEDVLQSVATDKG